MPTPKLTKAKLLTMMDEKLADLNLLRSALQATANIKQVDLDGYKKKFEDLVGGKGKK